MMTERLKREVGQIAANGGEEQDPESLCLKEMELRWLKKLCGTSTLKKKDLAKKLGVSRTTLWKKTRKGLLVSLPRSFRPGGVSPKPARWGIGMDATGMFTLWTIRQYHERFHGPVLLLFRPDNFQESVFTQEISMTELGTDVALCHS
jgi:predicted DNA-binding transcriptional regulator AlpA